MKIPERIQRQIMAAVASAGVDPKEIRSEDLERAGVPEAYRPGLLIYLRSLPGIDPSLLAQSTADVAKKLAGVESVAKSIGEMFRGIPVGRLSSKDELDQVVEMMARLDATDRGTWIVREAITTSIDLVPHATPAGHTIDQQSDPPKIELVIPAGAELFADAGHPAPYFEAGGVQAGLWIRHDDRVFRIDVSPPDLLSTQLPRESTECIELTGLGLAEARRHRRAFPEHWFPQDNGGSIYDWKKWT